jgi:uncharacterized protein
MFEQRGIAAVLDPVQALRWTARRESHAEEDDNDPARAIALDDFEISWLANFMRSEKVPARTMSFEQVDGFFHALIAGPAGAQLADCMGVLWNGDGALTARPRYDSAEQADYVEALLRRHWAAIGQRLDQSHPHQLILTEGPEVDRAFHWACGFLLGMTQRQALWELRLGDDAIATVVQMIFGLSVNAGGLTPLLRSQLITILPRRLVGIHHVWRGRDDPFPLRKVTRKIGRNEPCPCGSGKKYKRCCGTS